MNAWDTIKNILKVNEDDFDDLEDFDDDDILYSPVEKEEPSPRTRGRSSSAAQQRTSSYSKPAEEPRKVVGGGQVVDIHTTAKLQVVLTKPEHFDEASAIADNLNQKRTVVLNLESANREEARRLVDFLSGVAYANGGQLKRIANSTFIITPYNVDVMGDLLDELENSGVFF